jgi:predicted nucleic acid-binding protein
MYSGRRDPASKYRRSVTERWWKVQRQEFDVYSSEAVVRELEAGEYEGQQQAIAMAASLRMLDISDEAIEIADLYIRHLLMPDNASGDAMHLALASLEEMDYLLTWNIRHLANPNKVEHITVINRRLGLMTPVIVSPDALWIEEQL